MYRVLDQKDLYTESTLKQLVVKYKFTHYNIKRFNVK